jgi:Ca-activated chloride channel family protein
MASFHRFIIVVSAVTVVGVIQAVTPELPTRLLPDYSLRFPVAITPRYAPAGSEATISGKGTFTFIGDTRLVEQKMAELLGKINAPTLTDIKLNLKGIQQYQQFEVYPNVIADLYGSEPLVITYKQPISRNTTSPLQHKREAMLVGNLNHSLWHFSPKTTLSSKTTNAEALPSNGLEEGLSAKQASEPKLALQEKAKGINVLWARKKIAQLTRDKRKAANLSKKAPSHSVGSDGETVDIKSHSDRESVEAALIQEITSTALKHHIVSQYTSLVAVDITPSKHLFIESNGENSDGVSAEQKATREVTRHALQLHNVETAQSQQAFTLPQTATNAQLR